MKTNWKYLLNQFLTSTRDNFKKALKLSNYHDAVLKSIMDATPADPDWAMLYNRYHPMHIVYTDAYTKWKNAGGTQEGKTLNMDQLLALLITKINKWDVKVQNVFDKTSPEYKTIFPDGRNPFNSGAINTRVIAVQGLGAALTAYPTLVAVKTQVDAFYLLLDAARDVQEAAKGGTKTSSQLLDEKRIAAMTMQYGNLGFLISKYMNTPLLVAPFFELEVLRDHQQTLFTGILDAGENEPALIHTFASDDEISFKLTGTGQAAFYLATTPGGTDSTPVIIAGGAQQTVMASAFGITEYGTHRYLTAINSGTTALEYEIELL